MYDGIPKTRTCELSYRTSSEMESIQAIVKGFGTSVGAEIIDKPQ